MNVTEKDIEKIAKLARIQLTKDEGILYQQEISSILSWIEQLQQVDVSDINLQDLLPKEQMAERDDVVVVANTVNDVLANAPKSNFDMFAVPKMVE
ncbi:MAG: Glutamyl-tRNA(Gln) amidotransferase subunit C, chloroplastic/mitochondrial [Holosporales bacterium]